MDDAVSSVTDYNVGNVSNVSGVSVTYGTRSENAGRSHQFIASI